MYNTNYKCVKPFDVWLDAIGPDGKKIPYRVKRGTIWRLEWCGGEQSFKELSAQFTTSMIPAHYWLIGTILAGIDKNWNVILCI